MWGLLAAAQKLDDPAASEVVAKIVHVLPTLRKAGQLVHCVLSMRVLAKITEPSCSELMQPVMTETDTAVPLLN